MPDTNISYRASSEAICAAYLAYRASNPGITISAVSFVAGYNAALAAAATTATTEEE